MASRFWTAILFCALLFFYQTASAELRHALVIGNNDYIATPLRNPINDAMDMAAELKQLGYHVFGKQAHTNVDFEQTETLINNFTSQLPVDAVALFYFAGHGANDGLQQSYLIPIGANIQSESQIKHRAIGLAYVADTLKGANREGLNILLIDACRDRPFGRSFSRSSKRGVSLLDQAQIPRGTFIGLAAGDGQVASDGDGRNGVYTRFLLDALRNNSYRSIEAVHKSVAQSVYLATQNRNNPQRPVYQSDFFGEYCFGNCEQPATPPDEIDEPIALAPTISTTRASQPVVSAVVLGGQALFATASADLSSKGAEAINSLINDLTKFQEISEIVVTGHTDSRGSASYNQTMSERRAETVRSLLVNAFPSVPISAVGMGESAPRESNSTAQGRQANRRVEIQVTAKSITE